jgi:hypothetical protein
LALFIVVHHPAASQAGWSNEWDADGLLRTITTPRAVAAELSAAQVDDERVYVHRCAHAGHAGTICCSVKVESVQSIDSRTVLVRFMDARSESFSPPVQPHLGQNSYRAVPATTGSGGLPD